MVLSVSSQYCPLLPTLISCSGGAPDVDGATDVDGAPDVNSAPYVDDTINLGHSEVPLQTVAVKLGVHASSSFRKTAVMDPLP